MEVSQEIRKKGLNKNSPSFQTINQGQPTTQNQNDNNDQFNSQSQKMVQNPELHHYNGHIQENINLKPQSNISFQNNNPSLLPPPPNTQMIYNPNFSPFHAPNNLQQPTNQQFYLQQQFQQQLNLQHQQIFVKQQQQQQQQMPQNFMVNKLSQPPLQHPSQLYQGQNSVNVNNSPFMSSGYPPVINNNYMNPQFNLPPSHLKPKINQNSGANTFYNKMEYTYDSERENNAQKIYSNEGGIFNNGISVNNYQDTNKRISPFVSQNWGSSDDRLENNSSDEVLDNPDEQDSRSDYFESEKSYSEAQQMPSLNNLKIDEKNSSSGLDLIDMADSDGVEIIQEYQEVEGNLFNLSQTNSGSRSLQKFLYRTNKETIDQVINEIFDHVPQLSKDPYGNYMFQSLIQVCTIEQRERIVLKVGPYLVDLVKDQQGTHALQTLISLLSFDQEISCVVNNIQSQILQLSSHSNATHFVQKIIQSFDVNYLNDIYRTVNKDIILFANHQFCLCVLQCLITKYKNEPNYSADIIQNIANQTDLMILDPYGNYAIQHSYETYGEEKCFPITLKIMEQFTQFSIQRYSSNVIEKCISIYCENFHILALQEIFKNDNIVAELMKNKYGGYILQKILLKEAYVGNRQLILELIQKNIPNIHITKFKNKWQSLVDKKKQMMNINYSFEVENPHNEFENSNYNMYNSAGNSSNSQFYNNNNNPYIGNNEGKFNQYRK